MYCAQYTLVSQQDHSRPLFLCVLLAADLTTKLKIAALDSRLTTLEEQIEVLEGKVEPPGSSKKEPE